MGSKLEDGRVVESTLDGIRHYRVITSSLFEERGRPPSEAEQAETANVPTRPPPLSWDIRADYRTPRAHNPLPRVPRGNVT